MSSAWDGGSTRQWRTIRAEVLKRDQWTCQLRLPGCTTEATCVHHIHGRSVTGDDPDYLIAACQPCNRAVGEPPASRAMRPAPVKRRKPSTFRTQRSAGEWHPGRW